MKFLVDTNTLSEPIRLRPNPQVVGALERNRAQIAISSGVSYEILIGIRRLPAGARRRKFSDYFEQVVLPVTPILAFDADAAEWLAEQQARLSSLGRTRPVLDGMIAAVAATRGLTLVTHNTRDFEGYTDLEVVDWFRAG